jgi:Ca2+-binding RTX toxin-like protein
MIRYRKTLASVSAVAAVSLSAILPALAAPAYSLFGEATESGGVVTLVSDASPGFGGLNVALSGATFASLTKLSADFNVTDDNCVGGSPRFSLPIDTNNDNVSNGNIWIYLGPTPSFNNCTPNTWLNSGNLIGNNEACRFDTSQLAAGTQCNTYSGALALLGTGKILGVNVVADAGWAFQDGEQTVKIDNVMVNNDTYTFQNSCTPVNNNDLEGYWKFDETTGITAIDSAGGDNTGTHENGPMYVAGNPAISPNPSALKFDGTDDHVRVADSNDFDFGTGSFTVSAFVKTGTGDTSVLGNFDATQRGWGLYLYDSGRVNFFAYGSAGANDTSFGAPVLDEGWHHVAGVYTRSGASLTIDMYVDGVLVGSNTSTVGDITSSSDLLLGHYLGQPHYDGVLDDVRVYDRALSANEIPSLSNGCTIPAASSSSSSSNSSSSNSSSSSMSSSTSSMSSSSSSTGSAPICDNQTATIYVQNGIIVGGPDNGDSYNGTLRGSNANDVIVGTSTDDRIRGSNGDDVICGGDGNDELRGDNGMDRLFGENGADELNGGNGNDTLNGAAGVDELDGGNGDDLLVGANDSDELDGGSGVDIMCGGASDDTLSAGSGNDKIDGGDGSDTLAGNSGSDICRNGESLSSCENTTTAIPECSGV